MALPVLAEITPDELGDHALFHAFADLDYLLGEETDETMAACIHGRLLGGVLECLCGDPSPTTLQRLAGCVEEHIHIHGIGVRLAALLRRASASATSLDAVKLYVSAAIDRIRFGEQCSAVVGALEMTFDAEMQPLVRA